MEPGDRVRIQLDPSRVGTVTRRNRQVGERRQLYVQFPDGVYPIYEEQLELADEPINPLELLLDGTMARASDLRRLLTHVRLSGRLANLIYSMETTNTDFYAYQFKPVLKFLNTPAKGILIADEVGLGKTIEAGLVWTELRSRLDYRRLLVLCPAVLVEKWRVELRNRFGVRADTYNAKELLRQLQSRGGPASTDEFCAVCSISSLRPRRGWDDEEKASTTPGSKLANYLREKSSDEPLFDLVIIDEAHYLRNPETLTNATGVLLANVAERVLLLSATPIHLRSRDLFQILQIADEDTFSSLEAFDAILAANEPLVYLRDQLLAQRLTIGALRQGLADAARHPYLAESRQLAALLESLRSGDPLADPERRSEIAERLDQINLLGNVISRTRKREVEEWRVIREAVPEQVPMTSLEAEFYAAVTATVRVFAQKRDAREGFLLVTPQRQMSSSMPAAVRAWLKKAGPVADTSLEDFGIETEADDRPTVAGEIVAALGTLPSYEALRRDDSKYQRLSSRLHTFWREHPGEKVVLFSYFLDTLAYLKERLTEDGVQAIVLSGDAGIDKNEVLAQFASPAGPTVLLSSEVGSEGVDLQFCRVLVNYDLPWNPMRLEQRIGRLDRLGQRALKIVIWNLMYADTIDERIYSRLYERLDLFNRTLGGLEATLGEEIRELTNELLRENLSADQEAARIDQSAQALVNLRKEEERLEDEAASLVAYGDYILNQVKAARELKRWITGEDLRAYVIDHLRQSYPGTRIEQRPSKRHPLAYEIALTPEAKADLADYLGKAGLSGRTRLAQAETTPVQCIFENRVVSTESVRAERISQTHPLVRFVGTRQASELDGATSPPFAIRVGSADAPPGVSPGTYAFVLYRWSIEGLQHREQLVWACARLDATLPLLPSDVAERLLMNASLRGGDWPDVVSTLDRSLAAQAITDICLPEAEARCQQLSENETNADIDRANIQRATVQRHLERQRAIRLRAIDELRRKGRTRQIPAFEGQIRKLEENAEFRLAQIERRLNPKPRSDEIAIGVIRVGLE